MMSGSTSIPLLIIRGLFFLCAIGTGLYVANVVGDPAVAPYMAVAGGLAAIVIVTELLFSRSSIQVVSAVVFGTILGFLAGWLFTGVIQIVSEAVVGPLQPAELNALQLALTLVLVYFGITVILHTQDRFRFIVPYVEFQRELRGVRPFIVDSSAIIDGRIGALCRTALVDAPVLVPRFVAEELQRLSDSKEKTKRARGRRGLELLAALREVPGLAVEVLDTDGEGPVDRRLLDLTRERGGRLVTTDAALSQIAEAEGLAVLNLHALAGAFQLQAHAGDRLTLRIVRKGEAANQGVGYLQDGSMVVVEGGRAHMGKDVQVEVTSGLQTRTGQMYFARLANGAARSGGDARAPEGRGGSDGG